MKTTLVALALVGATLTPAAFAGSELPITVRYDANSVHTEQGVAAVKRQVREACKAEIHGVPAMEGNRRVNDCVAVNLDIVMQAIAKEQTVRLASNK